MVVIFANQFHRENHGKEWGTRGFSGELTLTAKHVLPRPRRSTAGPHGFFGAQVM